MPRESLIAETGHLCPLGRGSGDPFNEAAIHMIAETLLQSLELAVELSFNEAAII